jgi:SulP family sulfate permease
MRGVPLVDATGIEVLREIDRRQRGGGGALLLSGLQPRSELILRRAGFLDEVGSERVFWSADRAIRSLGATAPTPVQATLGPEDMDTTLMLTPHADQADRKL